MIQKLINGSSFAVAGVYGYDRSPVLKYGAIPSKLTSIILLSIHALVFAILASCMYCKINC